MLCTPDCFNFAIFSLTDKAPRVKWESARVIANTAHLFPDELTGAIVNLLANTEHKGTVVRWSAAQALSKIVSLNTTHNSQLVPALKTVSAMEEKPSIQKIYTTALKRF
jgi:HEAT repeat protein